MTPGEIALLVEKANQAERLTQENARMRLALEAVWHACRFSDGRVSAAYLRETVKGLVP